MHSNRRAENPLTRTNATTHSNSNNSQAHSFLYNIIQKNLTIIQARAGIHKEIFTCVLKFTHWLKLRTDTMTKIVETHTRSLLTQKVFQAHTHKQICTTESKQKQTHINLAWNTYVHINITQVEVPDGSKYVQTEDERTRGASCVQNYIVWKHQKRTKVWTWTHESLLNARKSGLERTKLGWRHENRLNARKLVGRTKVWTWTHESLVNARKSGHERTKVWWTHESLDINARKSGERTKVWTWAHESLVNARKSGHRQLPSGMVWTYLLPSGTSAWEAYSQNTHSRTH